MCVGPLLQRRGGLVQGGWSWARAQAQWLDEHPPEVWNEDKATANPFIRRYEKIVAFRMSSQRFIGYCQGCC